MTCVEGLNVIDCRAALSTMNSEPRLRQARHSLQQGCNPVPCGQQFRLCGRECKLGQKMILPPVSQVYPFRTVLAASLAGAVQTAGMGRTSNCSEELYSLCDHPLSHSSPLFCM
jgi:hypothetical protein